MHCTSLHSNVLYNTVLSSNVQHCTSLYCNVLQGVTVMYCRASRSPRKWVPWIPPCVTQQEMRRPPTLDILCHLLSNTEYIVSPSAKHWMYCAINCQTLDIFCHLVSNTEYNVSQSVKHLIFCATNGQTLNILYNQASNTGYLMPLSFKH